MRRHCRAAEALLLATVLTALAACGTRLPEGAFERPEAADGVPIRVGVIASATSPAGGGVFTGPGEGAAAYFEALNAEGGINGRPVEAVFCDDGGSGVGNNECVTRLIDEEEVFVLVATTALNYAGAPRVSAAGVPDIGGQPIGTAYDTYPHLYEIYGSAAPRDGGRPGWDGVLVAGTEVYRYFEREEGARTAAVVSYNQAASAAYARQVVEGLRAEGYRVVPEQVDFALPNFRAVAADMRDQGVDIVFDALDTHGNARLCEAMEDLGVEVAAKVTNVQNWNSSVPDDYRDAPGCRNALWVTGSSRNYEDVGHKAVKEFRDAMAQQGRDEELSQWQLEGWAAAMWFADAARSCDGELTRSCVEEFINRPEPYTASGLLLPVVFEELPEPPRTSRTCLSVARWQDREGWVSQGEMTENCFTVPQLPYRP
ncbi:ABC transporter substrate-binding protein [Streptomyces sp. HNM0663]|uniref:ABC transporter substrate-binding protein n=1 Tax=Streptomyces chengmaiensis TaxID=3040919 RepID=A0ABT6HYE7_9ACTN|nr:ABC transporter substrate-binding protein [Streptomyces chengmaiensis]MDH2392854.1 ABC transporter substrate-binding protein [Streptomyces chengmaiensis]